MTRTMTILRPDGRKDIHDLPETGELTAMQEAVGGYIELVPYFETFEGEPCEAYCNEEGKLHGLPVNGPATAYWRGQVKRLADVLVGNVIIIQPPEV